MSNEENAELEIIASVNQTATLTDDTEKAIVTAIEIAESPDADEAPTTKELPNDSNNPPATS